MLKSSLCGYEVTYTHYTLRYTNSCARLVFIQSGFHVLDHDITVSDEQIAEALNTLPADRRDIILLAYFLDMADKEIAERLNLVRRTVAYRRTSTLRELKKFMEGNVYE